MEQDWATFVSSLGFPIVAFIMMYRLVTNQMKENTDAIKNNTNIMSKIMTIISRLEGRDNDG